MSNEIFELGLVFGTAAVLGLIARALRQPLILAYIVTGVVIGVFGFTPVATSGLYELFSTLGVMFLLFLVGLEIRLSSLRYIGSAAGIIALGQISLTAGIGFIFALLFGLSLTAAGYVSIALALSSTIIIVKLISEKQDANSLYGKISVGILVWQDLLAMIVLLLLTGWQSGTGWHPQAVGNTLLVGGVVLAIMIGLGQSIMPRLFHRVARSPELVLVSSLAWVFIVVAAVSKLGLSIEIGGFLAGLALANASEHFHIANRIKPLRDFFLLLFFVTLGTTIAGADLGRHVGLVIFFSLFVIFAKPVIVWAIMVALGYHRRTAFLVGLTMGQISEFSLVLMAVGVGLGHIEQSLATAMTTILILAIGLSSFSVLHGDHLYRSLQPFLRLFERSHRRSSTEPSSTIRRPILVIGAHRTGQQILEHLPKDQVAVIDFDPDVVQSLRRKRWLAIYGDLSDPDVFENFDLTRVRTIISTSPSYEDNVSLLAAVQKRPGLSVIVRADNDLEARQLYQHGAEYVLVPQLTAGQHLGHMLKHWKTGRSVDEQRRRDLKHLTSTT